MASASTLELIAQLARAPTRGEAVAVLAARLGVEALLLFVRDVQLPVLVPAPGFPQTLPGGASWRDFLKKCANPGWHSGDVALSKTSELRRARAWVSAEGSALVFIGGSPHEAQLEVMRQALPLVTAMLRGEQAATVAMGHVEVARSAEFYALTLATTLDATRAELQHTLAEAARLGQERAIAAERLQKSSEEALRSAQETAELREQFIAILGHDLRSPLGTILVTSQMLLQRRELQPNLLKPLQRIERSADRISRMADDLLDFARTRLGGGMPITPQPINDLAAFFGQVVEEIGTAHPERRIELEVDPATCVSWDPDRIAQVLSNLLGNALKHSPEDSTIRVLAHRDGDFVRMKVHNLGAPILPELLGRIFEPFRRGNDAETGVKSGLGLGLYITDTIVRAHGGDIAVSSSADEGTTIAVRLPRQAPRV